MLVNYHIQFSKIIPCSIPAKFLEYSHYYYAKIAVFLKYFSVLIL